jgi:hypothetical protein
MHMLQYPVASFYGPKTTNRAINNLGCLLKNFSLSLSLSHTHTHTQNLRIFLSYDNSSNSYGLSFNAKMKCHFPYTSKQASMWAHHELGSTSKWTWKFHDGIAGHKMAVCCSYNYYSSYGLGGGWGVVVGGGVVLTTNMTKGAPTSFASSYGNQVHIPTRRRRWRRRNTTTITTTTTTLS